MCISNTQTMIFKKKKDDLEYLFVVAIYQISILLNQENKPIAQGSHMGKSTGQRTLDLQH